MTRLLSLTCLLLAAGIAAELAFLQSAGGTSGTLAAVPGPAPPPVTRQGDQSPTARDQWAGIIMNRPLFTPDRRPAAGARSAVGLPRLTGIIASPTQSLAIFQTVGEPKPVVAHSGETVAGWKVTSIDRDAVILSKANERVELRPRFTDGQPGATPAVMGSRRGHGAAAFSLVKRPVAALRQGPGRSG
jgi:hypothetical protein